MKKLFLLLGFLGCVPLGALADPAEDYAAGRAAFDRGDVSGAMAPLARAANAGHAKAQALYGYVLDFSEFDVEALGYYQKAAEQGDADGQYWLAQMYVSGEAGKKDPRLARQWLEKAAKQGLPQAVQSLGESFAIGTYGLESADLESPDAAKWINAAADMKSMVALNALLLGYQTGKYGLPVDAAKAAEVEARIKALRPDEQGKKRRRKG